MAENWPGWRGPSGDGISSEKDLPTRWSHTENVAWKTPLAGEGHSSPIVWEDRVFLTTSLTEKNERRLLCLNRLDGETLWERVVVNSPPESIHNLNSRASGTPATDGKAVYVTFLMAKGEEVVAVVVRDESTLQENIDKGVSWLNTVRPLLLEYNDVDHHTIPMTGDIIEM